MNVDELLKKREELKKTISSWQEKAAVAKANQTRIKKELSDNLEILKNDFECSDFAEAKAKLKALQEEVEESITEIETRLNALGS